MEFQLSDSFILVTVNKWSTPDDPLTGVESPVRPRCHRAASQVVQLVDCPTLDSKRNFQEKVAVLSRLIVLTEPTALRMALSRMKDESFETGWSQSIFSFVFANVNNEVTEEQESMLNVYDSVTLLPTRH